MFYPTEAQFHFSVAFQSPAWMQKVNVQFYYVTFKNLYQSFNVIF